MIAIPLTKRASWTNPPWITIALIVINLFVFVLFQRDDDQRWAEAETFYHESGLGSLEAGFYDNYLEKKGQSPGSENDLGENASEQERIEWYHYRIRQAGDFMQLLENGEIVPHSDPQFVEWHNLRQEYDHLNEQIVGLHYGFRPSQPRPFTWLSSMFLHGGWGHLIGNMVFLWLVGCLIEYGCRHAVFPVVYLMGGFAASGFFWLMNMQSSIPTVGASGAISGIMGAFAVFYGFKRVNIFLNFGFYFNYLKFPAIFLLPLWMGTELYHMMFNEGSPVAYAAHFGGLGGGALMAWGVSHVPGLLDRDAFESVKEDRVGPLLERALGHMGRLEYEEARPLLIQALEEVPDDTAIWLHLYTIDRQNPASARFHQTVRQLLLMYCRQPDSYGKACALFRKYREAAHTPKLSAELYVRISYAFIYIGEFDEAEYIILKLLKKNPQLSTLPAAILKLAQAYKQKNRIEKWQYYVKLLNKHYPSTHETRLARQQVA